VLCSDGLHGAVDATDFARIVMPNRDLELAVRDLVAMANQNDGSDNISVLAARIRSVERIGMYRGRPYRLH
jgi:serine/threonine protein phosphatase PrpC